MMNLAELRTLMKCQQNLQSYWPYSNFPQGFPQNSLIEIAGDGKTTFISRFLSENPTLRIVWIEEKFSLYPCALLAHNIFLKRLFFIEAGVDSLWTIEQAQRSQLFNLIVFSSDNMDWSETVFRRLQLGAEKNQSTLIFLSSQLHMAWPIRLQLSIKRNFSNQNLDVDIRRSRLCG